MNETYFFFYFIHLCEYIILYYILLDIKEFLFDFSQKGANPLVRGVPLSKVGVLFMMRRRENRKLVNSVDKY